MAELMPGQKRLTPGAVLSDIALVGWFVFALFPLLWMLLLAMKTPAEQTTTYFAFSPTLENFVTVLTQRGTDLTSVDFKTALLTSVINCGGAVIVSLLIGIPAAYAAGKWKFQRLRGPHVQHAVLPVRPGADGHRPAVRDLQPGRSVRHQGRHDLGAAAGDHAAGGVDPALLLPGPARGPGAGRAAGRLHPAPGVRDGGAAAGPARASRPRRCWRSSSPGTTTCSR